MTTTTLTITTSAEVTPEQLFDYIKAHCERGEEPCMLPESVHDALEASEIWVEEVEVDGEMPELKHLIEKVRKEGGVSGIMTFGVWSMGPAMEQAEQALAQLHEARARIVQMEARKIPKQGKLPLEATHA